MMNVLYERGLKLSRKKTRMGKTDSSFHFLGILFPGTQTLDDTKITRSQDNMVTNHEYDDGFLGVNKSSAEQSSVLQGVPHRFVPHARTLRKVRMQVNIMVRDGFSTSQIKRYLHQWLNWWLRAADIWTYEELLQWLIGSCWELNPAAIIAAGLLERQGSSDYAPTTRLGACLNRSVLHLSTRISVCTVDGS